MSTINSSTMVKTIKSLLGLGSVVVIARRLISTLSDMTELSIDATETISLFNTSFGKGLEGLNEYYEQAIAFQEELSEKLGINIYESMEYQARFNSMVKSIGAGASVAYTLSENLTKLGYDLSSLYNIDVSTAMEKLESGVISGQSKSLRTLGIDVTEDTVQAILDNMDIDVDYSSLSQAEKVVARYIAVLKQATIAEGDMAYTIESPANQLRVFNNQITLFKTNMGNLWQGLLGKVLPYINAIVMVINEMLEILAELFGYDFTGNDANISASVGADDLSDDLNDATDSATKLKKQLMGFDEINNITTTDSSSSSGASTSSGITQELLNALTDYDNLMDDISMKATEIRDKILDWLGVTDGSYAGLNKILDIVKLIGVAFGTWTVSSAITNLLKNLGILNATEAFQIAFGLTLAVTGIYAMYNGIKKLLEGDITLYSILETLLGAGASTLGIAFIVKNLLKKTGINFADSLVIGFGITLAIAGFEVGYSGIQKVLSGDVTLTNMLEAVGGNFLGGLGVSITLGKLLKNISKGGYTLSLGKTLGIAFGIGLTITGIETFISGLESNDLGTKIAGAVETALGVGSVLFAVAGLSVALPFTITLLLSEVIVSLATDTEITGAMAELADDVGGITTIEEKVSKAYGIDEETGLVYSFRAGAEAANEFNSSMLSLNGTVISCTENTGLSNLALSTYIDTLDESSDEYQEYIDIIEDATSAYKSNINAIQSTYDSTMSEITSIRGLTSELGTLVDENGRVIDGNEELTDVILEELSDALGDEYKRVGNVIYKNGEAIDSYSDLVDSIDEYLEEMEKEAIIEYYSDLYTEAVKQRQSAYDELIKAQQEYNEALASGDEEALETATLNLAARNRVYEDSCSDLEYYKGQVSDIYTNGADTIIETVSVAGEEVNSEIAQYAEDATETYRNMAQNNIDEWEEMYDTLESDMQASMLAQSSTLDTWSPTLESKWKGMAESDVDAYNEALSELDEDTKLLVETLTTNVEDLSDEQIEQWRQLATSDEESYNKALSSLPASTQTLINTLTSTTENLSADQIQAWADLAKDDKTAYENNLKGLDTTTSNRIQSCVDAINNKQYTAEQAAEKLADAVEEGVDTIDTEDAGKNTVLGIATGINKNQNNYSLWSAIKNVCSNVKDTFKSLLGIASPSKVMADLAQYIPLGIAVGIEDSTLEAVKSAKEMAQSVSDAVFDNIDVEEFEKLNDAIAINPNDFTVDTSQFVNYGEIAGSINTQSQVSVDGNMSNMIAQACYEAFCKAMKSEGINIEIEARTDEGIIFNKVQKSAKQYVMQTGENPFPVLI